MKYLNHFCVPNTSITRYSPVNITQSIAELYKLHVGVLTWGPAYSDAP